MGFGAQWPEIKQSLLFEVAQFGECIGKKEPRIHNQASPGQASSVVKVRVLGTGHSGIKQKQVHQDGKGWGRGVSAFTSTGH